MQNRDDRPEQPAELRQRAEEIAREATAQSPEDITAAWPDDARRVLDELRVHQVELELQNEELRRAILQTAMDGFWLADMQGRLLQVNAAYCRMSGYGEQELLAMSIPDLEAVETIADTVAHLKTIMQLGEHRFESRHRRKDGSTFDVEVTVRYESSMGGRFVVFLRDTTTRNRAERCQALSAEVLGILNAHLDLPDAVNQILAAVQRGTGFDAVGIRLRSGDDFPYFVQNGFSAEFLLTENTLIARDTNGNISLECTCGLVLSGGTDPANALFTQGGSSWTNNAKPLLDLPAEQDPRLHPRNTCIHHGYGSVAIIPIHASRDIVGLLQLNDRKKDCFTPELIHFLEGITASIGVALMRKRQEDAVCESEVRYRLLFEESRDALMTMAPPAWTFSSGNPAAVAMFGARDAAEFTALGPWEVSPERQPDGSLSADKARAAIEVALRAGSHFYDWTHRRLGGEVFPATVLLTRIETAGQVFVQATVRDITERKRAEQTLRESETRLRSITDAAQDAILMMDPQGRLSYWNPAAERILGYTSAEAIGQVLHAFIVPPRYRAAHQAAFPAFQQTGHGSAVGQTLDLEARRKDGQEISVQLSLSALQINGGWHAVGLLRDTTDRKRAEAELREINRQLEAATAHANDMSGKAELATRAKSEFLANMSHEIRTPMTAILGYADLLLEEHVGHAAQEHVAVIKRNGEQLLGLINDILDLSKVEAGKLQIEPIRCSPGELAAEIVSFMRVRAAEKQLNLQIELAGPLPATVLTDPLRLRQVLINLLGNAIKFTDYGEIRLTVRLTSEGGHPRLRFDVTDTGVGMNAEQLGQLFQPFTQVDSSAVRKFGGTGLGLCISKHLAQALGGDLEVRSQLGQGSTFSVTIDPGPLAGIRLLSEGVEAPLPPAPCGPPAAAGQVVLHGRILLADDSLDNQRLLALLLRRAGAEVTLVENGQLAQAAAWAAHEAGQPFDVILMDMSMPVLDGFEATRQLRQRGYTAPIVALTAYVMTEDCQKCLAAGCNGYASKPIDRQKLLATVAPWVARGRTPDEAPVASPQASATKLPTLLYSDLDVVDDPELGELVALFVAELPDRIKALEAQAKSRDWNGLARSVHFLKGAAGTYGFGAITPCAARLEAAVREAQSEERVLAMGDELVGLCLRLRAGNPDTGEQSTG